MKIKLPKVVGEELDFYQRNAYSFDEYYDIELEWTDGETYYYIMSEPIQSDRNQRIVNLLTAWIDGWEVE